MQFECIEGWKYFILNLKLVNNYTFFNTLYFEHSGQNPEYVKGTKTHMVFRE